MISRKNAWDVAEAGVHIEEIVERARTEGPQAITVAGREIAVVTASSKSKPEPEATMRSFLEFCEAWAQKTGDIELPLDRDYGELREIEF